MPAALTIPRLPRDRLGTAKKREVRCVRSPSARGGSLMRSEEPANISDNPYFPYFLWSNIDKPYFHVVSWKADIAGFKNYLRLEKSLSANSVEAYVHDVEKLCQYLDYAKNPATSSELKTADIRSF